LEVACCPVPEGSVLVTPDMVVNTALDGPKVMETCPAVPWSTLEPEPPPVAVTIPAVPWLVPDASSAVP